MKKKVLIVGLSSISIKHKTIMNKIGKFDFFLVSKHTKKNKNFKIIDLLEAKKLFFDYAFICSSSNKKLQILKQLENNCNYFFLEKPIADKIQTLKKLKIKKKIKDKIYIGYVFRHSDIVKKIKKILLSNKFGKLIGIQVISRSHLPSWRKHISYKKSVSAIKKKGGGVLLELSHEIDLIKYLFGNFEVKNSLLTNSKSLDINVEERADIILQLKNKVPASLLLDFNSKLNERRMIINFSSRTIDVDLKNNLFKVVGGKVVKTIHFSRAKENMFINQIKYFIDSKNFSESYDNASYVLKKICEIKNKNSVYDK